MKSIEKRIVKGYKVKNTPYEKARKRAVKEGGSLANMIECVVIAYAGGFDIKAVSSKNVNNILTLDEVVVAYKLKS